MNAYDFEWRRMQLTRPIGANAIAAIVGVHPFFYRGRDGLAGFQRDCIAVKRGDPVEWPDDDDGNDGDMARGRDTEAIHAGQLASRYPGHTIALHDQCVFKFTEDVPCGHCLPDARLIGSPDYSVELKCPRSFKARGMRLKGPAEYYVVGGHWTTIFTGCPAVLSIFDPDAWTISTHLQIDPNPKTQKALIEAGSNWYGRHVIEEQPVLTFVDDEPLVDVDQPKGTVKVSEDVELRAAALELLNVRTLRAELDEVLEAAKLRVLAHFDPAYDALEVPGIMRAWHTETKGRETFDHKRCVRQFPDAKKFYKRGRPFRTFRPYDLRPPDERFMD